MVNSDSPMQWLHWNPVKVMMEQDALLNLKSLIPADGRILLVTTQGFVSRGIVDQFKKQLGQARLVVYDQVLPNPELDDLDQAIIDFKTANIKNIVALGGGSVIDAAKTLAVGLPAILEAPLAKILRSGQSHNWRIKLPLIAIPTTSGTGAEVTPFATVWDRASHKKYSITGDQVYPDIALLDPRLTLTLPYNGTLYTGLDTISHALESLWNKHRTPISASFAIQALVHANEALPAVLEQPENLRQRSKMQQASLFAGLAISQTRTAIAHSISYPLTSHFGIPHGLACGFTLSTILEVNIDTLSVNSHEKSIFFSILNLLKELKLGEKVQAYASSEQIIQLKREMITKGRSDNFNGIMNGGLDALIESALS